jgi:hypothetical protein
VVGLAPLPLIHHVFWVSLPTLLALHVILHSGSGPG